MFEMKDYLNLPVFSEKFKEAVLNLIVSKKSIVAVCLNNILQNLENSILKDHEKYNQIESLRMLDFRRADDSYCISYLALGKEPEYSANGKWTRKNRQQGKIGKIIKNFIEPYSDLMGTKLSNQDIELFVNDLKAIISNKNLKFKLVKGEEIRTYYHECNYATFCTSNPLWNSCMRYDGCQEYFDIYVDNNDCEMLIMFDSTVSEEKIVGRALVWNKDGEKYVDRRYYMLDSYHTSMIDYIRSQQWNYKKFNSYDDDFAKDFLCYDKETNDYLLKEITLSYNYNHTFEYFPYSDTVKYFQGRMLTNDIDLVEGDEYYKLVCTSGDYEINDEEDTMICEYCGERVDVNETIYIPFYGYVCEHEAVFDYLDNPILASDALDVLATEYESEYVHENDIEKVAILYNGRYYFLPHVRSSSPIVELTEEEFEETKGEYEYISDNYYIKL